MIGPSTLRAFGPILRVARRPKHRVLVVARYGASDAALRHMQHLLIAKPAATDVLSDKILALARRGRPVDRHRGVLGGCAAHPAMGLTLIVFVDEDRTAA